MLTGSCADDAIRRLTENHSDFGIDIENVHFPTPDGTLPAQACRPEEAGCVIPTPVRFADTIPLSAWREDSILNG
jgi:hypothetical protein